MKNSEIGHIDMPLSNNGGIKIDETNLKSGLLGLVVALVEIIKDALKLQALKRMDSGALAEEEINKLGIALEELENVLENIKKDNGLEKTAQTFRDSLDSIATDVVNKIINPKEWGGAYGNRN